MLLTLFWFWILRLFYALMQFDFIINQWDIFYAWVIWNDFHLTDNGYPFHLRVQPVGLQLQWLWAGWWWHPEGQHKDVHRHEPAGEVQDQLWGTQPVTEAWIHEIVSQTPPLSSNHMSNCHISTGIQYSFSFYAWFYTPYI